MTRARAGLVAALLTAAGTPARAADEAAPPPWRIAATAYGYAVPAEPDFVMVTVPAELGRLHLEGRYNYEALHTGSAFFGVSGRWGEGLTLGLTPMVGGVFGALTGVAPALRLTLAWWKLELSSESEIVIDLGPEPASFFYDWSELGLSPVSWLRFGAVVQRTRLFRTSLDVQRGLFAGASFGIASVTLYELDAGWIAPTFIGALGVSL